MRVLVVEDENRMAALIRQGSEEEAYAVDVVGNGREALEWLHADVKDSTDNAAETTVEPTESATDTGDNNVDQQGDHQDTGDTQPDSVPSNR